MCEFEDMLEFKPYKHRHEYNQIPTKNPKGLSQEVLAQTILHYFFRFNTILPFDTFMSEIWLIGGQGGLSLELKDGGV